MDKDGRKQEEKKRKKISRCRWPNPKEGEIKRDEKRTDGRKKEGKEGRKEERNIERL